MLSDNFYKFIGAIECAIHFLSTQKVILGQYSIGAEPAAYDPMKPYQSIIDETELTSVELINPDKLIVTMVRNDLTDLIAVKGAFLQAAAALSRSLAPRGNLCWLNLHLLRRSNWRGETFTAHWISKRQSFYMPPVA